MKNVLIIGAAGGIAQIVTSMLLAQGDINLTLFLRKASNLNSIGIAKCKVIEGDAQNMGVIKAAVKGQDIVYINLAGDLEAMNKNIVAAMKEEGVNRVVLTPLKNIPGQI